MGKVTYSHENTIETDRYSSNRAVSSLASNEEANNIHHSSFRGSSSYAHNFRKFDHVLRRGKSSYVSRGKNRRRSSNEFGTKDNDYVMLKKAIRTRARVVARNKFRYTNNQNYSTITENPKENLLTQTVRMPKQLSTMNLGIMDKLHLLKRAINEGFNETYRILRSEERTFMDQFSSSNIDQLKEARAKLTEELYKPKPE